MARTSGLLGGRSEGRGGPGISAINLAGTAGGAKSAEYPLNAEQMVSYGVSGGRETFGHTWDAYTALAKRRRSSWRDPGGFDNEGHRDSCRLHRSGVGATTMTRHGKRLGWLGVVMLLVAGIACSGADAVRRRLEGALSLKAKGRSSPRPASPRFLRASRQWPP